MSEPLTRDELVEFLSLIAQAMPTTDYDTALRWNMGAAHRFLEYAGGDELVNEWQAAINRRDLDAMSRVFDEARDRILDIEIADLLLDVWQAVDAYPAPYVC